MAKISIQGMEAYQKQFEQLASDIHKINRGALGQAAGYCADQVKAALQSMPVRDENTHPHRLYGATSSEKQQIIANFGIARFDDTGEQIGTALGFRGYVHTPSRRFNDQVPTGMLVQCIDLGTRFRKPTHILQNAIKQLKSSAPKQAQDYIDQEIQKRNI